jgi:hypothetical protein
MKAFVRYRSAWLTLSLAFGLGCGDGASHVVRAGAGHASVTPSEGDGGASGDDTAGGKPAAGGQHAAGGKHVAGGRPATGGGAAAPSGGSAGRSSTDGGQRGQQHGSAGEDTGGTSTLTDAGDGGQAGDSVSSAGADDGGASAEPSGVVLVPGFSTRKWVRSAHGGDLVLEEVVTGFASPTPPKTRVRRLTRRLETAVEWAAPDDQYIADFCEHPSGELSLVLRSSAFEFALVRLDAELNLLEMSTLHDPAVATDPHAAEAGVTELVANGLLNDAARIGAAGELAFAVVVSSINAVIGYRAAFTAGEWAQPERTLIEPPVGLTPFLPIGGSFDTFGAIGEWFRAPLDLDENGNAYVAVWANPTRIRAHVQAFQDGLTPLPGDPTLPNVGDSDVLLTKLAPSGERLWSRVVGTEHEDEPYAIRAHAGLVAVAGRARRFPSFDNTAWDALLCVTTAAGDATDALTLELDASSILLGLDARPGGGFVVAGSDGWSQNPDGLSILSFGQKLLLELPALDQPPVRVELAAGPRHNELHAVSATTAGVAFAGHEDGPLTHSGDGDASEIHATGVLGFVPR